MRSIIAQELLTVSVMKYLNLFQADGAGIEVKNASKNRGWWQFVVFGEVVKPRHEKCFGRLSEILHSHESWGRVNLSVSDRCAFNLTEWAIMAGMMCVGIMPVDFPCGLALTRTDRGLYLSTASPATKCKCLKLNNYLMDSVMTAWPDADKPHQDVIYGISVFVNSTSWWNVFEKKLHALRCN